MKASDLLIRCYAEEEKTGLWVAVCLDFNLAAQADSYPEVKQKLESMISSYVTEALTIDIEYADQLLSRKAPLSTWLKYYYIKTSHFIHDNKHFAFYGILPMRPI